MWAAGAAILGLAWPPLFWPRELLSLDKSLWLAWAAACLGCAFCAMLPVDKEESITVMSVPRTHLYCGAYLKLTYPSEWRGGALMWSWAYSRMANVAEQVGPEVKKTVLFQVRARLSAHEKRLFTFFAVRSTPCKHARHSQLGN